MTNLDIEKLKKCIAPEVLQRSLLLADIQKYVMSLESDNIEEIRDTLVNTNYFNDDFYIKRFIENIFISCKYRGHRVLDYVTLVYEIYRSPKIVKREYLKKCIFEIHQSDCRQPWRLLFIWGCTHLFDPDEIYSYIRAYLHKFGTIDDEQMNLFLYFAPFIEKKDKPIFDRILSEMRLRKSRMNLPLIYHPFLDQFDQLRANDWFQYKWAVSDGFTNDCLIYAIRHDEYELFLKFTQSDTFDPNQRINESLLIRYPALMNRMTILEWASFHGARRIFDYLLSHGADPYLADEIGLNLMHFSVLGGHHYMITKCQELGFDFGNGVATLVAEMYRTDLFIYLYDQNLFKIDEAFTTTGTVLHRCATANNIFLMLFCIEKGVDINVRDKFDLTPLYYAVKNMSLDAVSVILSHSGVEWDATDKFNDTPLHGAAKAGNVEVFKALLRHKKGMLNVVDVHNRTPLVYAILESKPEIVECCLLQPDVQVNLADDTGRVPIFHACERGSIECFKIMIEMNQKRKRRESGEVNDTNHKNFDADNKNNLNSKNKSDEVNNTTNKNNSNSKSEVNNTNNKNNSNSESEVNNTNNKNFDAENKNILNSKNKSGEVNDTNNKNFDAENQYILNSKNNSGEVNDTNNNNRNDSYSENESDDECDRSLAVGIDFNRPRNDGTTVLHYCTQNNKIEFLRILLAQDGIDPNAVNREGMAPIHIAAKFGFADAISILLDNEKTDPNMRCESGMSPLDIAVRYSQKEAVEVLIRCERVDTSLATSAGLTAADLAMQMGLADIVDIFNKHKA